MAILAKRIGEYIKKNSIEKLCEKTWLDKSVFTSILSRAHKKYRKNTLDILYAFFWLEQDAWYRENMKKWVKPTESIFGEILRNRRLALGLTIQEVDKRTKINERQIARIEAGDSLPSYDSYTIRALFDLYGFDEEQVGYFKIFLNVTRTLVTLNHEIEAQKTLKKKKNDK